MEGWSLALRSLRAAEDPSPRRHPQVKRTAPQLPENSRRRMVLSMIESLVEQIEARFAELEGQMSDPEVISDRERYAAVGVDRLVLRPHPTLDPAGLEQFVATMARTLNMSPV